MTFAPIPWTLVRRWPTTFIRASMVVVGLGVALGQGVEPLAEVLAFPDSGEPFTDPVRWRVFGEFIAAGAVTYLACAVLAVRNHKRRAALPPA